MADNTAQDATDTIATDEVATLNGAASIGVKVQRTKTGYGDDGDYRDASQTYPLPVNLTSSSGNITNASGTVGAVNAAVTLNVSTMGNGTIQLSGGTYTGLTLAFEATVDGTNWVALDCTRVDGYAVENMADFNATTTRAWNFTAAGIQSVRTRVTAIAQTAAPTVLITAGPFLVDFSPAVPRMDGNRPTYAIQTVANTMNSATDYLALTAGTTKSVRISHVDVVIVPGATTSSTVQLLRRTALTSGGTAAAATAYDSLDPAANAAGRLWTTAGTISGTSTTIRAWRGSIPTAGVFFSWDFATIGKAPVLRPGEIIAVNNGTAMGTSANWSIVMEFTED